MEIKPYSLTERTKFAELANLSLIFLSSSISLPKCKKGLEMFLDILKTETPKFELNVYGEELKPFFKRRKEDEIYDSSNITHIERAYCQFITELETFNKQTADENQKERILTLLETFSLGHYQFSTEHIKPEDEKIGAKSLN